MVWVQNATPAVDAESLYPQIIAVCCALSAIAITIVGARLWIRFRTAGGLAADDYMSALSMLFALVYSALCIAQTRYGLGLPIKDRPAADLVIYTRINYAGRPFYQLGISFFKIALLISYLRLLRGTNHKTYRRVIIVTGILIFLGHFGCMLSLIFACTPVSRSWNPTAPGWCIPSGPSFTGYAIVTIISDVAVALLPIPILSKLNISMKRKLGLIVLFVLGLFTTLCSIFRYLQINRIQYGDGNSTYLVLWGTIEFNVGNIISSLPFLAPIFVSKVREHYSSRSRATDYEWANGSGTRSKSSAYKLSNIEKLSRDREKQSHNGTLISSTGSRNPFSSSGTTARGQSEEDIIGTRHAHTHSNEMSVSEIHGNGEDMNKNAIMKSVTYTVQVDDDGESSVEGVAPPPRMAPPIRGRQRPRDFLDGKDESMI